MKDGGRSTMDLMVEMGRTCTTCADGLETLIDVYNAMDAAALAAEVARDPKMRSLTRNLAAALEQAAPGIQRLADAMETLRKITDAATVGGKR